MVNVTLQDLQQLISYAVDAGIQSYQRGIDPDGDRIKRSEAERYVKRVGFQPVMLQKWTDANLLHPVKNGKSQNAPLWYSLADIKKLISSIKLKRICNESI
ncbi:MAG: hypothetical protein IKO85_05205 [Bacteroidaceae bacterium]|nr:hypothetical protein [Bacteroidaceae bacterium]